MELRRSEYIVENALETDRVGIVDLLTLAFSVDPPTRFVWSDPSLYLRSFPVFALAFAGAAFRENAAYMIRGAAAALWLPPGVGPDDEALAKLLSEDVPSHVKRDAAATFSKMSSFHPKSLHWYLPLIGVDPSLQGRGLATKLLRHHLALIDNNNLPCYLENSNPLNTALYERLGFELLGIIQEGDYPPLFPMLRQPKYFEKEAG